MTIRNQVIKKLIEENNLKKYDVINAENINFHIKYGRNLITHNEAPTLTTKCDLLIVLGDDEYK